MIDQLKSLGFNRKEARVYLALLEFGTQPASVIAKKTGYPKATVLFLFSRLFKKNYIKKSQKGRVFYFYADPADLDLEKGRELSQQQKTLIETVPLLQEFKNPFSAPPKILFFEGIDGCRKAYTLLLESTTPIFEFAAHNDLLKMGDEFMKNFVKQRTRKKVFMNSIAARSPLHTLFHKRDKIERRKLKMYDQKIGAIYSSIAVFENKTLLLNLYHDAFAIMIENTEVAETLKTIHQLAGMYMR